MPYEKTILPLWAPPPFSFLFSPSPSSAPHRARPPLRGRPAAVPPPLGRRRPSRPPRRRPGPAAPPSFLLVAAGAGRVPPHRSIFT
uniref:Uncharacterized protein n=1 Tax=Setaria italica TaxID=4555 RepID=K3XTF4_SETIT